MENIEIKNIIDAFNIYRLLLREERLCNSSDKLISNLSYQIDAYALVTILNFYNMHLELSTLWKSNLLMIRMYAIVSSEIIRFLQANRLIDIGAFEQPNNLNDIFNLRNKIHQFRYRDFNNTIAHIDSKMGRSRNIYAPRLDICLEYLGCKSKTVLFGTNVFQFHFTEAKDQLTVNLMQKIIRAVERQVSYPPSDFLIEKSPHVPKYKWETYCYANIIKRAHFINERVLDRVLLAFDDLCCVSEFFIFTIRVDKYLTEAPYLLFFLCKIVAIILDETFDNFKNYIQQSEEDTDGQLLSKIISDIKPEFFQYCSIMRNNLHYQKQQSVYIGEPEELYQMLKNELSIVNMVNRYLA